MSGSAKRSRETRSVLAIDVRSKLEEKMRTAVFTLAAAVLLAAGLAGPSRAANPPAPQTLVSLDFSKAADTSFDFGANVGAKPPPKPRPKRILYSKRTGRPRVNIFSRGGS